MYDAVNFFATSLHGLVTTQAMGPQKIACNNIKPWVHGYSLISYMRVVNVYDDIFNSAIYSAIRMISFAVQMELNGLTGKMRFDNATGNRNYFKVDVVRVQESKKNRLGSWDPVEGMTLTRSSSEMYSEFTQTILNKTFIVVGKLVSILYTINIRPRNRLKRRTNCKKLLNGRNQVQPYLMKCNATEKGLAEDEECFEGFAYELIEEMARFNKFKFKFTTNEDYGIPNPKTGKWNGMIGELQSMVSVLIMFYILCISLFSVILS